MRWTGMKRLLIRDNNVFNTVQKETKTVTESYTQVSTQKNYNIISNNDITLLVGRRESNDINLVLYADPAGTGTYKEHVHIYNTVLWLNRQMQMQLYTPDATRHFHSKFPLCIQCYLQYETWLHLVSMKASMNYVNKEKSWVSYK